jgi:predicted  nucleic acid-binding Zn-ribbon protein
MHPDLERLIRLQQIETFSDTARRRIAELPDRLRAFDLRLQEAQTAVDTARSRLSDNQTARRGLDRELATLQARLTKFKDQLMQVKTNREYQAMQKEIEVAQTEVRRTEDQILERMIEADDISQEVRSAEEAAAREQAAVHEERRKTEEETAELEKELDRAVSSRQRVMAELPVPVLALFEQVSKGRRGLAVAEAREGHCTSCNVRLRPQVFNDIRRNESLIQCDSCQRILYFAARTEPAAGQDDNR